MTTNEQSSSKLLNIGIAIVVVAGAAWFMNSNGKATATQESAVTQSTHSSGEMTPEEMKKQLGLALEDQTEFLISEPNTEEELAAKIAKQKKEREARQANGY